MDEQQHYSPREMALTQEQVQALCAPFAYEDHEFTRGFAYITEQAITRRLDSVDPGWQFAILETVRDTTSASVTGRLTVCGVARDGVGTQSIEYATFKDQSTGERKPSLDMAGNPREAGEVRKGAATDALKRAARLFGVGRYILDAPKLRMASADQWETRLDQASENAFRAYLSKLGRAPAAAPATNPFEVQPPAPTTTWTREQADSFNTECKAKRVTSDEALAFLGVAKLSEYQPGFSAARKALSDYVKSRPAQPNGAQEQVVF